MTAHPAGSNVLLFTRPARVEDAAPFAAQMRDADREEFAAFGDAVELLAGGIRESWWSYVAEDGEGYVAAWGCTRPTLLSSDAYAWCATTPRVLLHRRQFLQGSRAWVRAMQAEFDMVCGWCAADYALSVRWLTRWLGFNLGAVERLGPLGVPFVNFWWKREP